jgi:hypothetical protein
MPVLYRKRPAVVSAIRWVEINRQEVVEFCGEIAEFKPWGDGVYTLFVRTNRGEVKVSRGDFIVHDLISGEFYPCNPEEFKRKYEISE